MRHIPLFFLLILTACTSRPAPTDARAQWQQALEDGRLAATSGDQVRADKAFQVALNCAASFGEQDPERVMTLAIYAAYLAGIGQTQTAEQFYRQAIAAKTATAEAAASRDGLARLLASQGKLEQALPLLRESLDIREKTLGLNHNDTAMSAAMLADALRALGQAAEAEVLYRRALTIWENQINSNAVSALHGLGLVLAHNGKREEAQKTLEKSLQTLSLLDPIGSNPPPLPRALILRDLALLLLQDTNLIEAHKNLTKSLSLLDSNSEKNSPLAAEVCELLAGILATEKRGDESIKFMQRAISIWQKTDLNRLGLALIQYANICQKAGVDSEKAWLAAQNHWENQANPNHPYLAIALSGRASVLLQNDKAVQAGPLLERATTILEQHKQAAGMLLEALGKQVRTQATLKNWKIAITSGKRILELIEQNGGKNRKEYVQALNSHIALCAQAGDLEQAITLNREAIAIVEQTLGAKDPNLATALQNGAALLRLAGKSTEATEMEERAKRIFSTTLPKP